MNFKIAMANTPIGKHFLYRREPFYTFEKRIRKDTYRISKKALVWADQCVSNLSEHETEDIYLNSNDPIVVNGYLLREKVKSQFRNKKQDSKLKILVHMPSQDSSPAGYSIFKNMIEAGKYLGYEINELNW